MSIRLSLFVLSSFILAAGALARAAAPVTLANFPNSMVYAVQSDAAGNLYVAGFQGNFDKANPFVAKLSPTGQTLYSTTFAGSDFGIVWSIAVDSIGDVYVFGNTNSPDFPVTAGALQTTKQGQTQGFVAKLDPTGKIVYSTFIGGATSVTPGLASAPGLDSILVDAVGDVFITGSAATNPMSEAFPPAPAPVVSSAGSFVLELDPTGSKILAAISGVGGMIAMDSENNVYVAGLQPSEGNGPVAATAGAFESEPTSEACSTLGNFATCGFQYVAKLNPGLTQVLYATYVSGEYGATPAAVSVDAQGDVFVAGTTVSPDYPATPGADEPLYIASGPRVSCIYIINCFNAPPATGYVTEVNPTGTALVYSSYFGGTQTDTVSFAAFLPSGIYLGGSAGSADLPGFTGYPQPCLPQAYETRLSADATAAGPSRAVPGKVLAYDVFAGTLITVDGTGTNIIAVDPDAAQTPIACILDSADLQPAGAIAPGQLLSLFGEFSAGAPATPAAGQIATSLDGVTVDVNGVASALLYVGGEQINFQAPFGIAGATNAEIGLSSTVLGVADSRTLPVVVSNPTAFLSMATPPPALTACTDEDAASVNGLLPVALNADGSFNTCLNAAAPGSVVTVFLNGLGTTSAPDVTATVPLTVASVTESPGVITGTWQVGIQIPLSQPGGGVQVSIKAGSVAVRDANLVLWVQ